MFSFLLIITCLIIVLMFFLWQKNSKLINKILLLNSLASLVSLFICTLGTIQVNSVYIDIAIIYFLLSFVSNIAYLKYFIKNK